MKNAGILSQNNNQGKKLQNMEIQQSQYGNSNTGSNTQNYQSVGQNNPLKTFYSSIQSLIPKMSNPDPVIRLQAA